jgi:hypothetical protein
VAALHLDARGHTDHEVAAARITNW